ncbi:hypothetical protein SBA2_260009 [Acidobacteriia bacterium SbA2]|nr:hypothetical protein SBA2_260009 [Acidobacteriia bacterium SbA2]
MPARINPPTINAALESVQYKFLIATIRKVSTRYHIEQQPLRTTRVVGRRDQVHLVSGVTSRAVTAAQLVHPSKKPSCACRRIHA